MLPYDKKGMKGYNKMRYEEINEKLNAIYKALNDLTIKGTKNCSIVGAIASTIEEMFKDISQTIENEKIQISDIKED